MVEQDTQISDLKSQLVANNKLVRKLRTQQADQKQIQGFKDKISSLVRYIAGRAGYKCEADYLEALQEAQLSSGEDQVTSLKQRLQDEAQEKERLYASCS